MKLDDFFSHQVCINLDKRADRWRQMQAKFAEHDLKRVVRFPAADGSGMAIPGSWDDFPGAYGCLRSHLAVVEQARAEAWPSVLIFEDDAVLAPEFNARFAAFSDQLPDDWDMVFFGAIHQEPPQQVSDNVMRVTHSLSTYAYALKQTIFDRYIDLNRQALTVLDENTRALQREFNCYCFMPHLAWVEEDFSDVREETMNLWWLKESLVLWGPEMDEILKATVLIISQRGGNNAARRNLSFLVDYYARKLPAVALLVVEQGDAPRVDPKTLSPHCRYEFLNAPAGAGGSRGFNRGVEMFGDTKEFFIFLDGDIFLTREDIKANLLKCREHDFASAFRAVCELDEDDTLRLLGHDDRWNYNGKYEPRRKKDICDSSCIITKRGVRALGGWPETKGRKGSDLSTRVEQSLKVFDSPGVARRLFHG